MSLPDTASFCQVESSGEFRPGQRPLSTWGLGACSQQCRSPRVPGQGLRGATGIREPDMSVCQRISVDKRRTSNRIPASVDPQQLPGAAPASPVPQRHLAGSAGGAYPLRLRIGLRGSAHLRNNPWVRPLPFRRPPNRFCSHLVWGNKLLVGFRSCRLQCPICPGVYELTKPPCGTLPHPRAMGAKPGFLSGA